MLTDAEREHKELIEKIEYYAKVNLWPSRKKLDFVSWLKNFNELEKIYAIRLLSKFQYIGDDYCNELFKEALVKAGQSHVNYTNSKAISNQWKDFFTSCIISPVSGETASIADSGYSYARKARDLFGIDESQLLTPENALKARFRDIMNHGSTRPLIFVDDFIGSGSQFYTMWTNIHDLYNVEYHSHETLASKYNLTETYYCCMLGTEVGIRRLEYNCKNVKLCVGHKITKEESVFDANSKVWKGNTQREGINILRDISNRFKMPDTNGSDTDDWKGFDEQGLLLAINEKAPDATIGAIRWNKNGWQPLIK